MTGRTHDLAAFTALNIVFVLQPMQAISLGTVIVSLGANMIGGLLPDIDEATSDIWDKFRGGRIIGHLIKPLIGQHRLISHSLLGVGIIGYLLRYVLQSLGTILLVDMNIVWWALMIGYLSHLVIDSFTTAGVPWLFPIPIKIGFPPVRFLRFKTGGLVEKAVVFPGLLLLNGYLVYTNYALYETFFRSYLR